ncbi:MAG: MmcB family DNA repair protein [Methylocystis sp.]
MGGFETEALDRPEQTRNVTRGAGRLLRALGYSVLAEFPLPDGGRADLAALAKDGSIRLIEVKSSLADFRADAKWMRYRAFCDRFYFAIPLELVEEAFPGDAGLIVADAHGAALRRDAPLLRLAPATRRSLLVRFGALAADRLHTALYPRENR